MPLDYTKLPYSGTTVQAHKSKKDIEDLLYELGAKVIRWTERIDPVEVVLEIGFEDYVAHFKIETPDETNPKKKIMKQKQIYRAYYWYFQGLAKFVRFGLLETKDIFLPYAYSPELKKTLREVIDVGKFDPTFLIGGGK